MAQKSTQKTAKKPSQKANNKAREYTRVTIRRLDTLAGNECASPSCDKPLIAFDDKTLISKICHIEAASPKGARYNENMTDDERRHFDNLFLLCDECHTVIDNKDNELLYPIELLKEWKRSHESKQLTKLVSTPSLLVTTINAIANSEFEEDSQNIINGYIAFDISDKIQFNAIKRNKALIDEYKVFNAKISGIYRELEDQGSFKKEKLLRTIRGLYLKVKGKYTLDSDNPLPLIQDNADNIFEDIGEELFKAIEKDKTNSIEDISFAVNVIMVDAFMRCKILEEPQKYD